MDNKDKDINTFIEKMEERKKIKNNEEPKHGEHKDKKVISLFTKIKVSLLIIALLLSVVYFVFYIKDTFNSVDFMFKIINGSIILGLVIFVGIALIGNKKFKNIFSIISSITIIGFIVFNLLVSRNIIKLPTLETLKDFTNTSVAELIGYASANKIEIEQILEYSDNIPEGNIITQDIVPDTLLKNVKKIQVTVSAGPNYDKEVIISNMVGLDIDEALKTIEKNFLNKVTIDFVVNEEIAKDIIISQSIKGQIKRNSPITLTVSLGSKDSLVPIKMEDITKKSLFDATYYLKKNGVGYTLTYDYSDTVKKDYVIAQSIKKGANVTPSTDTVTLVISKGKKVIVPDISKMSVDEIVEWIIKNNLKVTFAEQYHTTIKSGDLISINIKKDDIVSEGTSIALITSKGQLKLPNISSITEFRSWADNNGIKYTETREYNTSIASGNIIRFSQEVGTTVDTNSSITVYISNGSPITIPNFIGMSRSAITTKCNQVGLHCTFYYTGYSSTALDIAKAQNIAAGAQVINGTYVSIGVSSGPAKTFNVYIQDTWFGTTADQTIASLRSKLGAACPGVTFVFVAKASNTGAPAGLIHESSPIKGGNNNFTQGNTYTIWVIN